MVRSLSSVTAGEADQSDHWLQVTLETTDPETVESTLIRAGAVAVTLRPADDETLLEPPPGETPLWQRLRVTGLFPQGTDEISIRLRLATEFEDDPPPCSTELIEDQHWLDAWKASLTPQRFGTRLWVCPTGQVDQAPEHAVVVELDPGMAFGTGRHPTTAMCLRWLDHQTLDDTEVIDFGCGSGILALAAAKLGAKRVRAVDHDPQAVTATLENAKRNGVADRIVAGTADALDSAPAEVLVANILLNPLLDLAPRFADLLRPGCDLLLTGLLHTQHDAIRKAYERWFDLQPTLRDGDWIAVPAWRKPR